jgi:hypothetical protein
LLLVSVAALAGVAAWTCIRERRTIAETVRLANQVRQGLGAAS